MGKLAYAAKITHVPSMYLSEQEGPHKGCRDAAIEGHREISRRCRALGVDTIVVFDTHWLVNSGYHINNAAHFEGLYTSNELPHFIKNLPYDYEGNPELGHHIAAAAPAAGVHTRAHDNTSLALEYGHTGRVVRHRQQLLDSEGRPAAEQHEQYDGREHLPELEEASELPMGHLQHGAGRAHGSTPSPATCTSSRRYAKPWWC